MNNNKKKALAAFLGDYVTPHKLSLFDKILDDRTRHITVVLEDIYQPHNASAVVRSCDCFGVQDLHVIENTNEYVVNPDVTLGSSKWVDIYRYNESDDNSLDCINSLRDKGYTIVGTTPGEGSEDLMKFLPEEKTAIFFGTELTGLSATVMDNTDRLLRIPMRGFTESFNISVSVALVLFDLRRKLEASGLDFRISDDEKLDLKLKWMQKVIKRSDSYISDFERQWHE